MKNECLLLKLVKKERKALKQRAYDDLQKWLQLCDDVTDEIVVVFANKNLDKIFMDKNEKQLICLTQKSVDLHSQWNFSRIRHERQAELLNQAKQDLFMAKKKIEHKYI